MDVQRDSLTMMPAEPPDRTFEEMTLEIDLSIMKGSPLDQESVPSISTNDDSQHSLVMSEQNDDLERTLPIPIASADCSNGNLHHTMSNGHKTPKPNIKCDVCGKEFQKHSRLVSHVIVHSDEKDFVCVVCGKGFKNKSQLQRHNNTHSAVPNFCCSICGRGFKHNDVAKHMKRFHSGPRKTRRGGAAYDAPVNSQFSSHPNIQQLCQSTEQSVFGLIQEPPHQQTQESVHQQTQDALHQQIPEPLHQQSGLPPLHQMQQSVIILNQPSHQDNVLQRPIEERIVLNQPSHQDTVLLQPIEERIVLNQPSHQDTVLQPKEDGKIENRLTLLQEQDITQHHSLDLGVSPVDSLSSNSNDSMQIAQTPLTFMLPCELCSMTFPTQSALVSHVMSHPKLNKKGKNKQHQCHLCHKIFTRASGLSGHMQLHTRTERRREPNPDFCCTICGKMFTRRAGLNAHVLQHGGVLRFWCDEPDCGKGFVHSYQLIRHKRIHSDILPYTCDVCGKSFRHNDLAKHMRTHTGEKPYSCEHCGKAFASSSSLRLHERMHLSLKDHMCEICNMGFTSAAGLRRHSKTHEGDTDTLCSSCGKLFPSKLFLSIHMQESQHCSQHQQQHHQQQLQAQTARQLEEVHMQQTQHMQVLPAPVPMSHVDQQVEVQQLPQIPMYALPMQMEAPNSISVHEVEPLDHRGSETALAAAIPQPAGQPASVDNLPVLVPFSVSLPISVPFGFNLSSSSDQMQLNNFLNWEQKF